MPDQSMAAIALIITDKEKKMKQVYIDVAGRMHSLYKMLMKYPPEGYQFITNGTRWDELSNAMVRSNGIYSLQDKVLNRMIPVNLAKAYLEQLKKPPHGTDLTYATGQLVFRKEPWVVDLEYVTQLAGYSIKHFKKYRRIIEKTLASDYCKKITSVTEAGIKTVLLNLDTPELADKVDVIRPAIPKRNFTKNYNKDKVRLLFVGSANISGNFRVKGGGEVLEAFAILHQSYPNLELVSRSDVPDELKTKYKGLDNLTLGDVVPPKQLEEEFKSSDIFLFPSHATPAFAILDAMSYELPVITTDVWANPELIENGKTGFIIKKSEMIKHYAEDLIPEWSSPHNLRAYETPDPKVVKELVEKTGTLIEDEKLRRRMGAAGRREVENGKFSIGKRNEKLRRIFDEATEES